MRISGWSSDVCSSDLLTCAPPMLGLTAKKPSPVIARSSDDSDWTRLPWLNCWRIDFTTVPEPIILVGLTDTLDAMTSANSVSERLKPLVEKIGRASCRERVCQYV